MDPGQQGGSAPYRTRETDPVTMDPRPMRAVQPALWDYEAAFGKAALRGRGIVGVVIVGVLLVVGSNGYYALRIERAFVAQAESTSGEHRTLIRTGEETACILSMTPEERLAFRDERRPDAWNRWCWWIKRREG